jgi:hypothetical protein
MTSSDCAELFSKNSLVRVFMEQQTRRIEASSGAVMRQSCVPGVRERANPAVWCFLNTWRLGAGATRSRSHDDRLDTAPRPARRRAVTGTAPR